MEKEKNVAARKARQKKEAQILAKNIENAKKANNKPIKILDSKGNVIQILK